MRAYSCDFQAQSSDELVVLKEGLEAILQELTSVHAPTMQTWILVDPLVNPIASSLRTDQYVCIVPSLAIFAHFC